jgi:hypothetical protein
MFEEYQKPDKGSVGRGIAFTLLLHTLQVPLAFALAFVFPPLALATVIFIGVSQCVYIVPALVYFNRNGESDTVKGMIITASITFLLNATCTAIVFGSLRF